MLIIFNITLYNFNSIFMHILAQSTARPSSDSLSCPVYSRSRTTSFTSIR